MWYSSYKSVGNISKHSPTNLDIKININDWKNVIKVMKNPVYEKVPCENEMKYLFNYTKHNIK